MTKAQERTISAIRRAFETGTNAPERHEFKRWEVSPLSEGSNVLFVSAEYGLTGDEGTWASILARDRATVFVGPRGGISAFVGSRKVRLRSWQVPFLDLYQRQARERKAKRAERTAAVNG